MAIENGNVGFHIWDSYLTEEAMLMYNWKKRNQKKKWFPKFRFFFSSIIIDVKQIVFQNFALI